MFVNYFLVYGIFARLISFVQPIFICQFCNSAQAWTNSPVSRPSCVKQPAMRFGYNMKFGYNVKLDILRPGPFRHSIQSGTARNIYVRGFGGISCCLGCLYDLEETCMAGNIYDLVHANLRWRERLGYLPACEERKYPIIKKVRHKMWIDGRMIWLGVLYVWETCYP